MNPMYYIGLDVHKRKISYCIKDSGGMVYAEGSLPASRPTGQVEACTHVTVTSAPIKTWPIGSELPTIRPEPPSIYSFRTPGSGRR